MRGFVVRPAAARFLSGAAIAVLLAGCGTPPEPLPTAPPEPQPSGGLGRSGMPSPHGGPPMGSVPPGGHPGGGLPPGGTPTYSAPVYPTLPTARTTRTTRTTTTPSPTRSTPPPAPLCRGGPTKQQVLDVIKGKPGIPAEPLEVRFGPYCASSWQFAIVGIVGKTADQEEQLLVVTTGRPASLQLVAAGTDVCTDRVENDAPPGIRVRACGF